MIGLDGKRYTQWIGESNWVQNSTEDSRDLDWINVKFILPIAFPRALCWYANGSFICGYNYNTSANKPYHMIKTAQNIVNRTFVTSDGQYVHFLIESTSWGSRWTVITLGV